VAKPPDEQFRSFLGSVCLPSHPRTLGKHGVSLWNRVTSEYDIEDVAGRELLLLAAQSLDRADALRTQIDQHGELITTRSSTAKFDGSNSRSVPSMSIAITD
jgi:hypothetical protein